MDQATWELLNRFVNMRGAGFTPPPQPNVAPSTPAADYQRQLDALKKQRFAGAPSQFQDAGPISAAIRQAQAQRGGLGQPQMPAPQAPMPAAPPPQQMQPPPQPPAPAAPPQMQGPPAELAAQPQMQPPAEPQFQDNPLGFNPELMRANMSVPNPKGLGFLNRLKVGAGNVTDKLAQGLFPIDSNAAQNMSAEDIKSQRNNALMQMGLGMMANKRRGFGGALASGYFGARNENQQDQRAAFQYGAANRAEQRGIANDQEGDQRYADQVKRLDRAYNAGQDQQQWQRGFSERTLASMDAYRRQQAGLGMNGGESLTGDTLHNLAIQTIKSPSLMNAYMARSGRYNAGERNRLLNEQTKVMNEKGIKPEEVASIQANVKAQAGSIKENQQAIGTLQAFKGVVHKNGDRLLELVDKIPDSGVPWVNGIERAVATGTMGSKEVAEFNLVLNNFVTETGRIVGGHPKLLGNSTDTRNKEISDVLSKNYTPAMIKTLVGRLIFEADIREQGFRDAMQESSRSLESFGMPGQEFPAAGGGSLGNPQGGGAGVIDFSELAGGY